jgi:predicted permease
VFTGILFGILPALGTRVNVVNALKQGTNQAGAGTGRRRMQSALIVAQVAVSVVLLVGAGLLLTSFYRLQRVDAGYRSDGVLSAQVYGNFSRYGNINALRRLYLPILERLDGQPGVVSAAITNAVPLAGAAPGTTRFEIDGRLNDDPNLRPTTDVRVASDRYFETIGIPLVSGRVFNRFDTSDSLPVAVINSAMTRYWQGANPIGTRISTNRKVWFTVVGVVGDVRQFGLAVPTVAQVYVPLTQSPFNFAGQVLVRTVDDPARMESTVRRTVHAIDPNQPVEEVRTLDDLRAEALAAPRLTATLLVIFAGLALLMTLAGIGGVIATSVTARTREFGVRMALGAGRETVLAMVVRQGVMLVALGLAIGLAAALALSRVLSAYLYQTTPHDPLVLTLVSVAFLTAGAIACLGPARRATMVDPLIALRTE